MVRQENLSLQLVVAFQDHAFKHGLVPASGGVVVKKLHHNIQVVFQCHIAAGPLFIVVCDDRIGTCFNILPNVNLAVSFDVSS